MAGNDDVTVNIKLYSTADMQLNTVLHDCSTHII